MTAPLSHRLQLISWTGIRRQDWVRTGRSCRGLVGKKESVWRTRAWPSLAGLHAQLLSVGRLVWLRFRAGVGPAVKGGHRAPFAVCVQAAIRRVVWLELAVPLGLLQCTNCSSTNRQKDKHNKYHSHEILHIATERLQDMMNSSSTYPAAPTVHSASLSHRCLAGGYGFFASCTGCTRWLCLESVLGKPVWQSSVSKNFREPWSNAAVFTCSGKTFHTQKHLYRDNSVTYVGTIPGGKGAKKQISSTACCTLVFNLSDLLVTLTIDTFTYLSVQLLGDYTAKRLWKLFSKTSHLPI